MTKPRIAAIAVAAVIGVFYWWTWLHSWGMHLVDNPLVPWLQANAPPREHPTLYPAILAVHDAVMNVLLAIPFAAMLALSARLNDWSCAIPRSHTAGKLGAEKRARSPVDNGKPLSIAS